MPMETMLRRGLPEAPRSAPLRTAPENSWMRACTARTSAHTSTPSTRRLSAAPQRSAMCSTERCSVPLMRSPLAMAAMRAGSATRAASACSSASVSAVTSWRL